MKRLSLLLLAFSLVFAWSCDKVDYPVQTSDTGGGGGNPTTTVRKILIEDFTGQGCQGCPAAAETAKSLKGLYGDQLVVVGIHAGYFATPPGNPYTNYNLSTPEGETYTTLEAPLPEYPNGYVSRKDRNGSVMVKHSAWGSFIEEFKDDAPSAQIDVTVTYNDGNRSAEISINSTALLDIAGQHNIVVYLTEDEVKTPQTFPGNVTDYEYLQSHVLRAVLNGTWGEELVASDASAGASYTNTYSYTLPAEWNEDKVSVVAYIRNTDTEEIIQVEEVHVK